MAEAERVCREMRSLTVSFYRRGQDLVASGFLVFTVGEGLIVSGSAMDLAASKT